MRRCSALFLLYYCVAFSYAAWEVALLVLGRQEGAAALRSGYAFDTVKVRLQNSPLHTYRSAWHCFTLLLKYEGVSLYLSCIVSFFALNAVLLQH